MQSTKFGIGALALVLFLVGCEHHRANVGINVINDPPSKSLCKEGLKARGSYAGTNVETNIILPPGNEQTDFLTPEKVGTVITLEAWCYGATSEEVGHTKVVGAYRGGPLISIVVTPPKQGEPLPVDCNVPTEQRGAEICIQVSFIGGA